MSTSTTSAVDRVAAGKALAGYLAGEVVETLDQLRAATEELVPLGFVEWPVLASRLDRVASDLIDLAFAVPDAALESIDLDLLEVGNDLRSLAAKFQARAKDEATR